MSYSFPRQEEFNFLNGTEALTVRVYKTSTANLLAVADGVNVDFEVYRIQTAITERGSTVEAGYYVGKRDKMTRAQIEAYLKAYEDQDFFKDWGD